MRKVFLRLSVAIIAGLSTACSIATTPTETSQSDLQYSISIQPQEGAPALVSISIRFTGEDDGTTDIALPQEWGGATELWTGLIDFTLEGDEATLEDGDEPFLLRAIHAPGETLVLRYTVIQNWPGVPQATNGNSYYPTVQPGYVHLIGSTIFATPGDHEDPSLSINLSTVDDWALASDLEHVTGNTDLDTLMSSITVAGDFRVETRYVDDAQLRIAIRGDWDFVDADFADTVQSVVQANHQYWQAEGMPYLVTVLPLAVDNPNWQSLGGTNLADSFAFFSTRSFEQSTLIEILAHEHGHTWNSNELGGLNSEQNEALGYWFSEGFTDFLAQRVGVRGGLWDAATGIAQWNARLTEYASTSVLTMPNSMIATGFWSDYEIQKLPYQRGQMYAAYVEHLIRAETDGAMNLDTVLFYMRAHSDEFANAPDTFVSHVLNLTGVDLTADHERFIENGEMILLDANTFGACGVVETLNQPVFAYGLELQPHESGHNQITAIDPDGPAANVGFEVGMFILGRLEGTYGDGSTDTVFRVEKDGVTQDIRYRATNGDFLLVQHIIPNDGDLTTNGCADLLAGN